MTPPQLVINADDYAISPGVSEGIRKLILAGRVSATSCMTGSEYWVDEGAQLRKLQGSAFSAGLHITLTDQNSSHITASLAPHGRLPSLKSLWFGLVSGKIKSSDIELEINTQVEKFVQVYGAPPQHIDGHHHVQQLPKVRKLILDLWKNNVLPRDTWLRVSSDTFARCVLRGINPIKEVAISLTATGFRSEAKTAGVCVNDGFAGVYDLRYGSNFEKVCERALNNPTSRMVFMCHPGLADAALAERDPVAGQRSVENDYLTSDQFAVLLNSSPGKLVQSFI